MPRRPYHTGNDKETYGALFWLFLLIVLVLLAVYLNGGDFSSWT